MTVISAPRSSVRVARFERMLLSAASAIAAHVEASLDRRAGSRYRDAARARNAWDDARRAAQARGSAGLLPR